MRYTIAILMAFLATACSPESRQPATGYDFDNPSKVWQLPRHLVEASGLCYAGENSLALVQDEGTAVYFFTTSTGTLIDSIPSHFAADIEGIALVGSKYYLANSDGRLHVIEGDSIRSISTPLEQRNNLEGLCLDPNTGQLLLACKGHPPAKGKGYKVVYTFDPEKETMQAEPLLRISTEQIGRHPKGEEALARIQAGMKKRKTKKVNYDPVFQPSGINVHPQSGDYYILSAETHLLAVFGRDGSLKDLHALPAKVLPKAEGIAFAPDGSLYIGSEQGCPTCAATIAVFKAR